mmetsp:Transcript_45456/g.142462  ORF Transcript_45456/g.142462 Transcript_45456/m.142462 type:complete len:538 (+) Transcript_45456:190-1803(+)
MRVGSELERASSRGWRKCCCSCGATPGAKAEGCSAARQEPEAAAPGGWAKCSGSGHPHARALAEGGSAAAARCAGTTEALLAGANSEAEATPEGRPGLLRGLCSGSPWGAGAPVCSPPPCLRGELRMPSARGAAAATAEPATPGRDTLATVSGAGNRRFGRLQDTDALPLAATALPATETEDEEEAAAAAAGGEAAVEGVTPAAAAAPTGALVAASRVVVRAPSEREREAPAGRLDSVCWPSVSSSSGSGTAGMMAALESCTAGLVAVLQSTSAPSGCGRAAALACSDGEAVAELPPSGVCARASSRAPRDGEGGEPRTAALAVRLQLRGPTTALHMELDRSQPALVPEEGAGEELPPGGEASAARPWAAGTRGRPRTPTAAPSASPSASSSPAPATESSTGTALGDSGASPTLVAAVVSRGPLEPDLSSGATPGPLSWLQQTRQKTALSSANSVQPEASRCQVPISSSVIAPQAEPSNRRKIPAAQASAFRRTCCCCSGPRAESVGVAAFSVSVADSAPQLLSRWRQTSSASSSRC